MRELDLDFLPDDVREFWKSLFAADPKKLAELEKEVRGRAKRLAGVWETEFIDELYASLQDAIAHGQTVSAWIKEADAILSRYTPEDVTVLVDPSGARGGEFSSWYGDLVFRMQASNAYGAARYAEMFSPQGIDISPYWIQSALKDDRTRPDHAFLDGKVFRKDDPTARGFLAPWDFNCRCLASDLDEADFQAGGYKLTRGDSIPFRPPGDFDVDRVRQLVPRALRDTIGAA